MPVVDVGGMGMRMLDGFVCMLMNMIPDLRFGMSMHMVFIMNVAVDMHHPFMCMAMGMSFAQHEEHPCQEDRECDKELHIRNGPEYQE